jgi:transposase-like protein
MVTIILHCTHCQSQALVRNGHAPHGKQLYRCRACGRQSRENPTPMPMHKLAARRSWGDRSKRTCQRLARFVRMTLSFSRVGDHA